jgi:hypothetical protein
MAEHSLPSLMHLYFLYMYCIDMLKQHQELVIISIMLCADCAHLTCRTIIEFTAGIYGANDVYEKVASAIAPVQ